MRTDTGEFTQYNQSESQLPVFVVEIAFDDAGEDFIYLTSHPVEGISGEVFESVLTDISGTTQKINPDKALSEIGALSFSALDDQLTEKQREKLNDGLGLRGKRVRFYAGFQQLDWSNYTLVQTQIIRSASYKDLVYSWKCSDIQREMRKEVFEVKSTALARTLEPGDTEVEVYNTADFQMVKQPPSPSGKTDAPGQKVGYIILEGDNRKEIIRYTGTTGTKFTGCTRGVLGTRPIRVEKSDDEGSDNAPKVEEYVYLEMPAPMLAYAILTGNIYGEPGETLPDHWHLGIKPEYIRTADYVGIGEDLWDIDNPDNGLPARIAGVTEEDGKQFVEEQFFLLMGCYAPIYSNGEIGLRRMTGVLSGASSARTLSRDNITDYSSLSHDMGAIINRIVIAWNWVDQREEYTRTNLLIDQFSIDAHGDADLKQLEFRALHGSRHSYNTLRSRFDALRDRYAGPPLRLSLDLMPDQNDLEVGDIVRVQLDEVEDYTGEFSGIDRAFEVQQVKVNWKTGAVSVELFGSSQKAEPLPPEQPGASLPDGVYRVAGATEISAANFPGKVSSSGGITSVTGDIDLAGADDLRDPSAIYYCMEDLTINAGVTVTVNKNTQIRVKGFFQINGKMDGRGRGFIGGKGMDFVLTRTLENREANIARLYPPRSGYIGSSSGGGGYYYWSKRLGNVSASTTLNQSLLRDKRNHGERDAAEELDLKINGHSILGLPANITGQPGSGGGSVAVPSSNRYGPYPGPRRPGIDGRIAEVVEGASAWLSGRDTEYDRFGAAGGDGGKGGAGLSILSAGAGLGAAGQIDLSGEDGGSADSVIWRPRFDPDDHPWSGSLRVYGGEGGAGAPGALFFVIVGATSSPPTLSNRNAVLRYGDSSENQANLTIDPNTRAYYDWGYEVLRAGKVTANDRFHAQPGSSENRVKAHARIQYINGEIAPEPDVPEYSKRPASLTVTEALNTPKTPNANLSTLEVSVSAPDDSAYSHALVEYRPEGEEGWSNAGPASPEALITVASDGTTYDIRARSVSTSGLVSDDYASGQYRVAKIIGAEPDDPDIDDQIVIPTVRGLELEGQGNETDFGGRDAKFVWRATTIGQWFELGSEGQLGASASELDLYFRDYQVEVWAEGSLVRTEWVVDPAFVYTYEKNAEDYYRQNAANGAWREFELRVYCRGRLNQISKKSASLAVQNPAPEGVLGLEITPGFNVVEIAYERPLDLDFAGVQVWVSEVSGFDPEATEPRATVSDNNIVISGLEQGVDYFVRVRPFDDFGITGAAPTSEFKVKTKTGLDVEGLSGWAYQIDPADRAFIEQSLDDDAVPSEKIESLAVAKLTAGVINATGPITTESIFRAVDDINNPQVQVGMGSAAVGGTQYLQWATRGDDLVFGVDEAGNLRLRGAITIESGSSGIGSFSDAGGLATKDKAGSSDVSFNYAGSSSKGGNASDTEKVNGQSAASVKDNANAGATFTDTDAGGLAYKNSADWSTEITGSGKPESGATVGADWNSTLSGIPARVSNTAVNGLNLTDTHLGFYQNGWKTYLKSDGSFHFGGQSDNFIDWNGSKLAINTDNLVLDPQGNAAFSGELQAASGTLGDEAAGEYIKYENNHLTMNTKHLKIDANGSATYSGSLGAKTVTAENIVVGAASSLEREEGGLKITSGTGWKVLDSVWIDQAEGGLITLIADFSVFVSGMSGQEADLEIQVSGDAITYSKTFRLRSANQWTANVNYLDMGIATKTGREGYSIIFRWANNSQGKLITGSLGRLVVSESRF
ncbi:fibronectin type III domain-containing protein [Marinobacter adhaerens]|uniref:Fibronectin type III domain-containing protein n=1 Tax=Marinobacter adhaerens TaxID=1033846 RepID=A0A851HSC2_9GAMM|nr:fibronectin type III domain-containing protein [Marinobacter adhaerens]NWN92304.1 fibronectin type III domain-containing protein [Marinobacter adhaerens]